MALNDDLEFSLDTNSFWFSDSPETFNTLMENSSLLVSENAHNELGGLVPVSVTTSDIPPGSLVENSNIGQETLKIPSSFGQDLTTMVTHNQSFLQGNDCSNNFNVAENFYNMSSTKFGNMQRENLYNGNSVSTSTINMMTSGLQLIDFQHGPQQPLLTQMNPNFSQEPYVSTMMRSNLQEVGNSNGLSNLNLVHGCQNFHHSMLQEKKCDHNNLIIEQLKRIYKIDQMQQPKTSDMFIPTSMGALVKNQFQIPFASTSNAITNPKSETYAPFVQTSYQRGPIAYGFQNPSLSNTTCRTRRRPQISQSFVSSTMTNNTIHNSMSLVPSTQTFVASPKHYYAPEKGKQHISAMPSLVSTTQALLTSPRQYSAQEKGKQHVSANPSFNPNLYNQYQNSYTNSMIQQSGNVRQHNYYGQCENEQPSYQRKRIMLPYQEKSMTNSSMISLQQDGNMRPRETSHHEESSTKNTLYDPLYASVGLPIDPHLRLF